MINLQISIEGVNGVNLTHLYKYVNHPNLFEYFDLPAGQNHCKLLAYLSQQLPPGSKVADLGTFYGQSATALAFNPEVKVWTFDISDQLLFSSDTCKDLPNVHFIEGDCKNYIKQIVDSLIIFLDVAPHDGDQERKVYQSLQQENFKGLLICDDILYSDAMKNWWASISTTKYDVTPYGHWSGTGIVVFDPQTINIEIL